MIDDIDKTIATLLKQELPAELTQQVTISFSAPDKQFPPPSVSLPAIDVFLYDIRENLELRTGERMITQKISDTQANIIRTPVHINYSYIITAWSGSTTQPNEDEHRLLGAVLQVLWRYPTILPVNVLQGALATIEPLPKVQVSQPTFMQNLGDFWNAMGGRPKPLIHYMITVPLYPHDPIKVPLVTTTSGDIKLKDF